MIKLIVGAAGSGKSTAVCDMIKSEIETSEKSIVLIVPEQQAVAWETRMSTILPPSANLRLEITNFTRLSNSVFREYGGLADKVTDDGSRSLMVWRAMLSVSDELLAYKAGDSGHEDRAIPYLMKAVDELKQSGISPADAEAALDELLAEENDGGENGSHIPSLAARLSDAVHVYAAYNAILHEDFIDRGDLLANLADTLASHPYFMGKSVYVDSFFSLTAAEEKILSLIMHQADDTTVTFSSPSGERADDIQFHEIAEYMKKIKSVAVREGLDVAVTYLPENRRHARSPELMAVEKNLFSHAGLPEYDGEKTRSDDVHIIRCADRYDEAEACASIIAKLVREGYKYSDIAVVAHDIGRYEGIADTVLRRHGIRTFISEASEISSSPAVKLIVAALSVVTGGWMRRDIIKLIKTGMTPSPAPDPEDVLSSLAGDLFENYTYMWNIRGRRMYCADRFVMNPEGYKEKLTEEGEKILALVNGYKDAFIPPLDRFLSIFGDGRGLATVREIAEKIVVFAEEYGVADTLAGMSENARAIGMIREAEHTAKSWDYVCEILDKMVSVIGDCPLNAARFARLFSLVASDMDKGTIPTGVDEVVLGSASGVRFDEKKCVIMLGALEDEFPASVGEGDEYFDERDKLALESVGLNLSSPDTDTRVSREYFMFYRVASSATEQLYITAPTGSGAKLSPAADEVEKILSSLRKDCTSVFGTMPLSEILYDRESALYLLSRRTDENELALLRKCLGEATGATVSLTAENDTLSHDRTHGGRLTLSQSAIDTFVRCPFMYTMQKKVKAEPTKRAELRLNDIGSFVHRVLERFFGEISVEKLRTGEITRDEMNDIANGIITDYIDSLAEAGGKRHGDYDGRMKYLLTRLSRYVLVFIEALSNELSQSRFTPAALELPIGLTQDGNPSVEPLVFECGDGSTVTLCGIADRVDVYDAPDGKRYIRIIDYKTGEKEFSLDNISRGMDIQLLIYLFSLWKFGVPTESGEKRAVVPAGAVYFSTRPKIANAGSITAADENRQKMIDSVAQSGVLLDDEKILRAMEETLAGQFIPVGIRDGKPVSTDRHLFLSSSDGFGELAHKLEEVLTDIASEMRGGTADARPTVEKNGKSPCAYCDYDFVCRRAKNGDR